jgi:hypothetical protein
VKNARLIADALGLPENTVAATIRLKAGKPVRVECEYLLIGEPLVDGAFQKIRQLFQLVERTDHEPAKEITE